MSAYLMHRLEWDHQTPRDLEWALRTKQRERLLKDKKPIPSDLHVHPYTEAHRVGEFWRMVYGLWWEEK